jgi:hypothetical protein
MRKIFLSVKRRSKFVIIKGQSAAILQYCNFAIHSGVMNVMLRKLGQLFVIFIHINQVEVTGYDCISIFFSKNPANKWKVFESILG